MKYFEQSIVSNGFDFITVRYEDRDGGFEFTFNKTMTKEFFRKLRAFDKYINSINK